MQVDPLHWNGQSRRDSNIDPLIPLYMNLFRLFILIIVGRQGMNWLHWMQWRAAIQCRSIPVFWEGQELVQRPLTELMFKDFGGNLVRCVFSISSHPVQVDKKICKIIGLLACCHVNAMQVDPVHWNGQSRHDSSIYNMNLLIVALVGTQWMHWMQWRASMLGRSIPVFWEGQESVQTFWSNYGAKILKTTWWDVCVPFPLILSM